MTEENAQATKQRPGLVTVLCILTWIGQGLTILFAIIGLVAAGALASLADIPGLSALIASTGAVWKTIFAIILAGGAFYGAIMMWNLKKLGFWIYSAANVILLILNFGIFGLIITALFIVLYGINLKHME